MSEKKKSHKKKLEESEEGDDVFDRFTDPTKKRKRKEKQDKQQDEKRQKFLLADKLFAVDLFNSKPALEEQETWLKFAKQPLPEMTYLQTLWDEVKDVDVSYISYHSEETRVGIFAVMECLNAAFFCTDWLTQKLDKVGWKMNCTNYDPVAVSASKGEILSASLECYKMSIKQMQRLIESKNETQTVV